MFPGGFNVTKLVDAGSFFLNEAIIIFLPRGGPTFVLK